MQINNIDYAIDSFLKESIKDDKQNILMDVIDLCRKTYGEDIVSNVCLYNSLVKIIQDILRDIDIPETLDGKVDIERIVQMISPYIQFHQRLNEIHPVLSNYASLLVTFNTRFYRNSLSKRLINSQFDNAIMMGRVLSHGNERTNISYDDINIKHVGTIQGRRPNLTAELFSVEYIKGSQVTVVEFYFYIAYNNIPLQIGYSSLQRNISMRNIGPVNAGYFFSNFVNIDTKDRGLLIPNEDINDLIEKINIFLSIPQ